MTGSVSQSSATCAVLASAAREQGDVLPSDGRVQHGLRGGVRQFPAGQFQPGDEQLGVAGADGDRYVDAGARQHRADRLLARLRHRRELELEVFLRVAERLLAVEQPHRRLERRRLLGVDLVEAHADALDPLGVGPRAGERVLELLVVDDAALLQVDQEHLAGLQAPLLDDALLRYRQHTRLRGEDHHVVVGDDVARRAEPVAVERRANLPSVGEGDGGGGRQGGCSGLNHTVLQGFVPCFLRTEFGYPFVFR